MRRTIRSTIVCLCALMSAGAAPADWPQAAFDAGHTRHNRDEAVLDRFSARHLELAWTAQIPGGIYATPIVADGRVFVGWGDGRMYAFDEVTGENLWTSPAEPVLFLGSAAYADGLVFASASARPLRAYDAVTGARVWQTSGGGMYRASPTVVETVVYATRLDGTLSALDSASGTELWSAAGGCCVFDQAPTVDDGRVFQMRTNATLTAYDAVLGDELWSIDAGSVGTVAAADGKIFHTNNPDVIARDQVTGEELWRAPVFPTAVVGSPAVADGLVFAQSASLVALDEDTGDLFWTVPVAGSWGPSAVNGVVYASEPNGVWKAFDERDGTELWSAFPGGCSGTCSEAIPVVANGTLLLAGPDSVLRAYRPTLTLTISGECPGEISINVSGATPDEAVVLASSGELGSFELGAGSCAGTELGLAHPTVLTRVRADAEGEISITRVVGPGTCSAIFQAIDRASCRPTNTFVIP